jgi:hypothetical protein
VWATGESSAAGWGPAANVETTRGFEAAAKAMKKELARQWIVWVEGNHMINEIELDEKLDGYRLAGTDQ